MDVFKIYGSEQRIITILFAGVVRHRRWKRERVISLIRDLGIAHQRAHNIDRFALLRKTIFRRRNVEDYPDKTSFSFEHVTLTEASFAVVKENLENQVCQLDLHLATMLRDGDAEAVDAQRSNGPKLWIFSSRGHGGLLRIAGLELKAWQYEIGNPITATSMTKFDVSAGLYAPLKVLLRETTSGGSAFEYDLPSCLFGQFGDDRVTAVGRELDDQIDEALRRALAS